MRLRRDGGRGREGCMMVFGEIWKQARSDPGIVSRLSQFNCKISGSDTGLVSCCQPGPRFICPPVIILGIWHLHVVTESDENFGLSQLLYRRPLAQLEQEQKNRVKEKTTRKCTDTLHLGEQLVRTTYIPTLYRNVNSQYFSCRFIRLTQLNLTDKCTADGMVYTQTQLLIWINTNKKAKFSSLGSGQVWSWKHTAHFFFFF